MVVEEEVREDPILGHHNINKLVQANLDPVVVEEGHTSHQQLIHTKNWHSLELHIPAVAVAEDLLMTSYQVLLPVLPGYHKQVLLLHIHMEIGLLLLLRALVKVLPVLL
jgi:hypothetical protein